LVRPGVTWVYDRCGAANSDISCRPKDDLAN
jgi:hypothetical protein